MLELATINPRYVIGPLLDEVKPASVEIVGKLLRCEVPSCVHLGLSLVDVRDVASAYLSAMTEPQAAGNASFAMLSFTGRKKSLMFSRNILASAVIVLRRVCCRTSPCISLPSSIKKYPAHSSRSGSAGHGIVRAAQEHAELATATCGGGDCEYG